LNGYCNDVVCDGDVLSYPDSTSHWNHG